MELLLNQFATLSNPQRMGVFRLLMRRFPDALPAGEIARVLGLKASTTSVYLSALTQAGLITQDRQGTSLLYQVNLDAARGMVADLFLGCCGGRPDLCPPERTEPLAHKSRFNVLFICTGNSARSIFAEAVLRHAAGARFEVFSAGTAPQDAPNPVALDVLRNNGISTDGLHCKTLSEFQGGDAPQMDFVFTVCDMAANDPCPSWAGQPITAHWGLPDPAAATGSGAEKRLAFQQTFEAVRNRIHAFTALPISSLQAARLQTHLDTLAHGPDLT